MQVSELDDINRLVKPQELADRLGVSRRALCDMEKAGIIPRPLRLSPKVIRFDLVAVMQHIRKRAAK